MPAVYPYLLDDGFVMIAAPTIRQLLVQRRKTGLADIVTAIEAAGNWLRAYHGSDLAGLVSPLPIDTMLEQG